jgi:outer membrane scaffolding protein for murein synthesis (MipA/OmpV family)
MGTAFMYTVHNCNLNIKELFMLHSLRSILFVSIFMLGVLSASAHAEEITWAILQDEEQKSSHSQEDGKNWEVSGGGGAMYGPAYEGSDKYKVIPLPDISIEYKNGLFFANIWDGIGSYPLQGENYKVGASVGFTLGRQEEDDKKNLRGMGDIGMGATVNLLGEYDFGHLKLSGKISKGPEEDYGTTARVELGAQFPVTDQLMIMGSVGATWADEEHMKAYFGVSSSQSARSGHRHYATDSGIKSVGFTVGAFYTVAEQWDVKLMRMGDQLLGDAAGSPIEKT